MTMYSLLCSPNAYAQQAAAPAAAQPQQAATNPAPAGEIEEVVVTARQRSENQVDVPISIQTFTEAQIAADGIHDLHALQNFAGFTFQEAASTQGGGREFPALIFRGLQSTYGGGQDNSGSVFVDGIYVSAGQASIDTADVKQIEVLKGPQNVFFGKNTFGGAINFITSNPSNEFGGTVEASGTARGSNDVNLMVEGPIIDGILDGRLNLQNYDKAAQYHSSDGGDLGAEKTQSVTGTLYATPTDDLWLRFRGHYQEDNDSAADLGFIPGSVYGTNCNGGRATNAKGTPVPVNLVAPYFCGTIPSLGQLGDVVLDQSTAIPGPFAASLGSNSFGLKGVGGADPVLADVPSLTHSGLRRDLLQLSGQLGYDLPYNTNFALNAGYNKTQSNDIWDLDRSTNGIFINAQPIQSSDYTVDARLSSDQSFWVRGVLGGSVFHSHYELSQDDDDFYDYGPTAAFYSGTSIQSSSYVNEDDDTKAVYGSIDYDIFPWLTVTGEGRYQHDVITDLTVGGTQYSKSFNNLLPRAILKFHPEQSWDFYASYSEGVQPASLQTGFINATPTQRAYLSGVVPGASVYSPLAHLDSWEVGGKQVLLDNRLEYGVALYDEKWIHQQTSAAVFNPSGCGVTQLTAACPLSNSGSFLYLSNNADIKGIEFNTTAQITPQLSTHLSVDYKYAVWTQYYNSTLGAFTGGATHFNGNQLSRVPPLSGAFDATYKDTLYGDWDWFVHPVVTYTSGMYESEINIGRTNPYARVNANLGIQRDDLTLEFYAVNLFADKNWDFASRVPELGNFNDLITGYQKYEGVLVQAPDVQDFGFKLTYHFHVAKPTPAAPTVLPTPVVAAPPPPPTKPVVEAQRSFQVFFDFDKSEITQAAAQVLQAAAEAVKAGNIVNIVVTGHTDTVGSAQYNLGLSQRRAAAVKAGLVADGVAAADITATGVGKTGLLVPTADGVREPQNRRATIVFP